MREEEVWNSHLLCCVRLPYHMQETFQSQILYLVLRIICNTYYYTSCYLELLHDAVKLPMFLLLHAKTFVAFHVSCFKISYLDFYAVSEGAWVFCCKEVGESGRELTCTVDTAMETVKKSGKSTDVLKLFVYCCSNRTLQIYWKNL